MEYQHTQHGPMHHIISASAMLLFFISWVVPDQAPAVVPILLIVFGCLAVVFALSFRTLTVADDGDRLALRYGPLPLFRKSIVYSDITSVEAGKSSLIDGWGIHYVPSRGWTYNLWGYDCATVHLGEKIIRIGSDDLENLVAFLKQKTRSA